MRRILLVATMASVALASCVKDESVDLTQQAKKLSFEAPVMGTQSRADVLGEISGTTYPTNEEFVVYAMKSSEELTSTTWENGTNFWGDQHSNGLIVTYKNTNDWENSTDVYYWPKDGYLSFAAYSPASLNDGGTVTFGNNGWVVNDFKVNSNVGSQIDLMCANPVWNEQEPDTDTGVNITFKHTLSSVVFSAINPTSGGDGNFVYKINSITISGNIAMQGDMSETGNTFTWEYTGQTPTTFTYSSNYTVTSTATEFMNGINALLLIPQDNIGEVEVTLNITRTAITGGANIEETYDKTVKLQDFVITSGTNENKWIPGSRYVYNFIFGGTKKIYFSPTVNDWNTVNLNVTI